MLTAVLSVYAQCDNRDNGNPVDGYCDRWGNYVPGYITNRWWMTGTPQYTSGRMVFYHPGVMQATAEYRGIDYDDCVGGVSLMSPIDIGRKVWIKVNDEWHGPFCVVDCAKKGDMYSVVVYRQEVIEVDFSFAEQMGMATLLDDITHDYEVHEWYLDVEVWLPPADYQTQEPNPAGDPIHYPTWWFENAEYATGFEPRVILTRDGVWKEYANDRYWRTSFSDYPELNNLTMR